MRERVKASDVTNGQMADRGFSVLGRILGRERTRRPYRGGSEGKEGPSEDFRCKTKFKGISSCPVLFPVNMEGNHSSGEFCVRTETKRRGAKEEGENVRNGNT